MKELGIQNDCRVLYFNKLNTHSTNRIHQNPAKPIKNRKASPLLFFHSTTLFHRFIILKATKMHYLCS